MSAVNRLDAALQLHRAGQLDAAWQAYADILAGTPEHPDALHLSGLIAADRGDFAEGIGRIERAIAADPRRAIFRINLSLVASNAGQLAIAESASRAAVELEPGNAKAWLALARLLRNSGRQPEAIPAYDRALVLDPRQPDVLAELARELVMLGHGPTAIQLTQRAIGMAPQRRDLQLELAGHYLFTKQYDASIAALRTILQQFPGDAEIVAAIGQVMIRQQRYDEAGEQYRQALQLDPACLLAEDGLIALYSRLGLTAQALATIERKLARLPNETKAQSSRLFLLNYQPELSPAELARAHFDWGASFARQIALTARPLPALARASEPGRKLRVGYVSADLKRHSVAYFIAPVLQRHDRQNFEVYCYSSTPEPDEVSRRLSGLADVWREAIGLDDDALCAQIRQDRIDILIDLSGHSADHRLGVFARRAAAVQCTWLGYPHCTGLRAIDYRLVDAITDPAPQADALCSESLVRLPAGFLCYRPDSDAGDAGVFEPPALGTGSICFGSFNHVAKIGPPVIALWAQILARVPGSRLFLKAPGIAAQTTADRLHAAFASHGIAPERLLLAGPTALQAEHMAAWRSVDIGLDPFPYNGTTTTCDALWMGVPTITLAGDRHAARVGASLLSAVGHPELIAGSTADYVDRAVALANDLPRLRQLHRELRGALRQSPLMDETGFVGQLEAAYRQLWQSACAKPPAQ